MKPTNAISMIALAAALVAGPALADASAAVDLGVNTGVNVSGEGLMADVTGSIGASAGNASLGLDALIDLITTADYSNDSFSGWSSANVDVTSVLNVDQLFDASGNAAIDAAVEANLDEQSDLSAAIGANADLSAWLETNGIDAVSVIAIDVAADGSVDVYEG